MRLLYFAFVDAAYAQLFVKINQQFRIFKKLNSDSHCCVIGVNGGQVDMSAYEFEFIDLAGYANSPRLRSVHFLVAEQVVERLCPDIIYFRYPFFDPHTLEFVSKFDNVVFEIQSIAANEVSPGLAAIELEYGPKILSHAKGIVAVTNELLAYELSRSTKPFPTYILSNGIDPSSLPFSVSSKNQDHLNLLCLAHFNVWQGYDRLISGLAEYPNKEKVVLHFAGTGPELEKYIALANAKGLERNCIFYGNLSREDVDVLVNRCQVGIGTLALHRKGMRQMCALKNREYCLRGIPFVFAGSDVDFTPDLPFLRVFPATDDPVDFSVIMDLARCVEQYPEIRAIERQYAEQKLSWEHKIRGLCDFFLSLKKTCNAVNSADKIATADAGSFVRRPTSRVLIACTHYWPSVGGVETIAENLGVQLLQLGYAVDVATLHCNERSRDYHRGIRILSLNSSCSKDGLPEWVFQLREFICSGRYAACILLADPRNLIIWSVECARIPSATRLIIQPIINQEGYQEWCENTKFRRNLAGILKGADAAIALTRNGIDNTFMREEGVEPVYLPNAVAAPFLKKVFRQKYGIDDDEFLVLNVANLWPVKNQPALIEAVQRVSGRIRLVVIGYPSSDTDYVAAVHAAVAADSRSLLIQGLPAEEVADAMAASDLVLLASHAEVSPVTVMEAMSHGKPWITTPECGCVQDLAGGVVTALETFPTVIEYLKARQDLRRELGSLGYDHWYTCFRWEIVAPQWDHLIQYGMVSTRFDEPEYIALRMTQLRNKIQARCLAFHPLVSVIVPTYNRPNMLKVAIQSILDQTFQDFEIIVVNDAGQDVSAVIAACCSPKIRYLPHATNKGLAAARNTGIRAARGKYIAYLDDDDRYYPDHLEILVNHLESTGHPVAYTEADRVWQESRNGTWVEITRDQPYQYDFDVDEILVDNCTPVLCVMHRRDCLDAVGMFDESLKRHEDWDLWIRLSRHYQFDHISKVTCAFSHRLDESTMSSSNPFHFLASYRQVCQKHRKDAEGKPWIQRMQKQVEWNFLYAGYEYVEQQVAPLLMATSHGATDQNSTLRELQAKGITDQQIAATAARLAARSMLADESRVIGLLREALQHDSQYLLARLDLVSRLLKTGELDEAAGHVQLLLAMKPGDPDLSCALADIYTVQRHDAAAAGILCAALEVNKGNQELQKRLSGLSIRD